MDTAGAVIAFHEVCGADDLWIGDMDAFVIADKPVLLVNVDGAFKAYADVCPHQAVKLSEGKFDGCVLTCRAHRWEFDATTGLSINPSNQRLVEYPVRVVDGMVQIGDVPLTTERKAA